MTLLLLAALARGVHAAESEPPVPGAEGARAAPSATPPPAHEVLLRVAWAPAGTGAVDAALGTSAAAGALDPVLRPPLRVAVGQAGARTSWLIGGGLAWFDTTRLSDRVRRRAIGALLLEVEARRALRTRGASALQGWAALHGTLPHVGLSDAAWTADEAEDAADSARSLERAIGGVGVAGGVAASWRPGPDVPALGVRAGLRAHASRGSTQEEGLLAIGLAPEAQWTVEWSY